MSDEPDYLINADATEWTEHLVGEHWGGAYKPLTPALDAATGPRLGVNLSRCPPGRATVPFHAHARADEVFYVLSGKGLLRYGEEVRAVGPGDCISCPAGGEAHQIANPFEEDLVYLSIGGNDPDEVCVYPDSGKVLVRSFGIGIGHLERTEYQTGEPERPTTLDRKPTR